MRPSQSSSLTPDKNDLSGGFITHMFGSTTNKNVCGISDRSTTGPGHHQDKDSGSKKQSFEFLSLSTGNGLNANSGANRMNNCLGVNGQAPYLHSLYQANTSLPYSIPQTCFSSKAYRDQVAVASMAMPPVPPQVHHQMPQYFANAFNPGHTLHTGTAKPAQLTQPKLQQQPIWTSQVAAQFRPGPLLSSHIASWQTRRQDPRISTQHIPPSQPSKYLHISQQH